MILLSVVSKGKRTLNDATISHIKGQTASEHEEIMSNLEAAEYYSMLASAISGGVESPIQFVTQVIKFFIFIKYLQSEKYLYQAPERIQFLPFRCG